MHHEHPSNLLFKTYDYFNIDHSHHGFFNKGGAKAFNANLIIIEGTEGDWSIKISGEVGEDFIKFDQAIHELVA